MKAETFLRKLRVTDLDAKVTVSVGYPLFTKYHVKDVKTLQDGSISITLGKLVH